MKVYIPGVVSLVPRPSTPPVFDRLQYAKTEGLAYCKRSKTGGAEGLGTRLGGSMVCWMISDHNRVHAYMAASFIQSFVGGLYM